MARNTEGLKRSGRLRSESATQRALAALQRMDASDREINFRTVAAEAGSRRHGCTPMTTCAFASCDRAGRRLMLLLQRQLHGIESACLSRT
jgi:hypothetical protein